MGFEPTILRDLAGCSNHWATGDSRKGEMWVFDWDRIARSHSQMMTWHIWTHWLARFPPPSRVRSTFLPEQRLEIEPTHWLHRPVILLAGKSRNFRQFQNWSNGHRINWNQEKSNHFLLLKYHNNGSKLSKNSNKTQESQEGTWMDKTGEV